MDDKANDQDSNSFIPTINFTDLAYAAPIIGVGLLVCFAVILCCHLWRRCTSSSRGAFDSSSNSYRAYERPSQSQRQRASGQNHLFSQGRSTGQQFVSWARDQMQYQRNAVRSSVPGQNCRAPPQTRSGCNTTTLGNNLHSLVAAQYPRATQGSRVRNDQNSGGRTTFSNSEGFSQATAPPPSYSYAVGYQNAPGWNLPGYGYQSTEPRTSGQGTGGEMGQGEHNDVLPPPYEAAVANGQNARRT